ncbi:MAG TPA: hypothetical protein VK919_01990, partial [Solirubrobacterales bacterium]|nr:hypothetical protein [Solirubrobacterales bacterium]
MPVAGCTSELVADCLDALSERGKLTAPAHGFRYRYDLKLKHPAITSVPSASLVRDTRPRWTLARRTSPDPVRHVAGVAVNGAQDC